MLVNKDPKSAGGQAPIFLTGQLAHIVYPRMTFTGMQGEYVMESKITYFETISPENTTKTFELVRARSAELGISKVIIASTTGATARAAMDFFKEDNVTLVVIPHQFGFIRKVNPFPSELIQTLRDAGHHVHFSTMLFHTDGLYGTSTATVMANLLRCFSQGVKVCFEIVMMATDGGLASVGEQVIAIAGTGCGSDTALVMEASSSQEMTKLRVREIMCKPLNPLNIEEIRKELTLGYPGDQSSSSPGQ